MAKKSLATMLLTADELKQQLPITYVMHHYGHTPQSESSGRLHYYSPFREDNNPSFDVFYSEDGIQRYGDFADPENRYGSVIDLVMQFEKLSYAKAMPEVRHIFELFKEEIDWTEELNPTDRLAELPDPVLDEHLDLPVVSTTSSKVVHDLLRTRPGISIESLQAFDVRDGGHYLAAIYPDRRAIRIRNEGDKWFERGSKVSLYHAPGQGPNEHLDRTILLVEGESDAWAAYGSFGEDMVVCAIPGTGHLPEKYLSIFMGRQVLIAFDGDSAGRNASRSWAAALSEGGTSVSILPMPEGRDLASFQPEDLVNLMKDRRQASANITDLRAAKGRYVIVGAEGSEDKAISDWNLEVVEILRGEEEGGHAYVCKAHNPVGELSGEYILRPEDLASKQALSRWCRRFHGAWWGSTSEVYQLVAELEEQAVYVPVRRLAHRPMLVQPSGFCLPGLQVNTDLVFDETSAFFTEMVWYPRDDTVTSETVERLLAIHKPEVMHPILAWLAIAPLRSRYKQFPQLFVSGASGSGKTTILENSLRIMSNVTNYYALTSTTPYAVAMKVGSTNCLPVWFDEYRPGGRRSAIETLDQLARDAYTKTVSPRGGMHEDKTKLANLETDAPIVISGEDIANEQSHQDRMVRVVVPLKGKGTLPGKLVVDRHFAQEYLWWLASRGEGLSASPIMRKPEIYDEPYIEAGFNERQSYNFGVLDAGWRLLGDFVDYLPGEFQLPEAEWTGLYDMAESDTGDRIVEFLQDAYETWGPSDAMYYDPHYKCTFISSQMVMQRAQQERMADLPFRNSRALLHHLEMNLDGERLNPRKGYTSHTKIRYVSVDGNLLEDSDDEEG